MTFKEKNSQAYKCGCVVETYKVPNLDNWERKIK